MTRLPPSAVAEIRARAEAASKTSRDAQTIALTADVEDLLADRAALVAEVERLTGLVEAGSRFRFADGGQVYSSTLGTWRVIAPGTAADPRTQAIHEEFPTRDAALTCLAAWRKSKEQP